jgi:hypothetical protein
MAVIEYRITVDANNEASVVQDVLRIDKDDIIIFSTEKDSPNITPGKRAAIRYNQASPFVGAEDPAADEVFIIQSEFPKTEVGVDINHLPTSEMHIVQISNAVGGIKRVTPVGTRTTFHFDCGEADPDPQKTQTTFKKWGGGGSGNPDPGTRG